MFNGLILGRRKNPDDVGKLKQSKSKRSKSRGPSGPREQPLDDASSYERGSRTPQIGPTRIEDPDGVYALPDTTMSHRDTSPRRRDANGPYINSEILDRLEDHSYTIKGLEKERKEMQQNLDQALDRAHRVSEERNSLRSKLSSACDGLEGWKRDAHEWRARHDNAARTEKKRWEQDEKKLRAECQVATQNLGTARNEIGKLKGKLEDLNKAVQERGSKLGMANAKLSIADGRIEGLERQTRSLGSTIDKLEKAKKNLEEEVERSNRAVSSFERDLRRIRTENETLQTQDQNKELCIREMELELNSLKETQSDLVVQLRSAQASAFQLLEQAQWMPEADRDISAKLDGLGKDIHKWSKRFASKTMLDMSSLSHDDADRVKEVLPLITQAVDSHLLFQLENRDYGSKLPAILLMGALSHCLYEKIFANPFFFERESRGTQDLGDMASVLSKIYNDISQRDPKGASRWRSETLRLLDPQAALRKAGSGGENSTAELRAVAALKFAIDFISGDARAFFDTKNPNVARERQDQLIDIARRAAELSYQLGTQRTQLSCEGIDQLAAKESLRFDHDSELLEPHFYHTVFLSDDSSSLDGEFVAIIAHPAVIAYGDSEGQDFSRRKVWKKAIVWMVPRA